MERYDGIPGISVPDLLNAPDYPGNPSFSTELTLFEVPTNAGDDYGVRVSGYLCAPETGTYYFFVAGNNDSELHLSTTAEESDKVLIASNGEYANPRQWDKFATQKSQGILLIRGESYYIEALMKEATFGDNLAVGWRRPSDGDASTAAEVVPGSALSPAVPETVAVTGVSLSPPDLALTEGETAGIFGDGLALGRDRPNGDLVLGRRLGGHGRYGRPGDRRLGGHREHHGYDGGRRPDGAVRGRGLSRRRLLHGQRYGSDGTLRRDTRHFGP